MMQLSILLALIVCLFIGLPYLLMLYNCRRKVRMAEYSSNGNKEIIKAYQQAPGPFPWPIVGNLPLLIRYKIPFQGLAELSNELGDIFTLTLGSTRCLVINNLELIREVLNQNGKFFGGRPDFLRYHKLFGGDRNNSLALCDWSLLQQKRRNLARRHCSPRVSSSYYSKMLSVGSFEIDELMDKIKEKVTPGEEFEIKHLIQQTCANMFMQYMCSVRFDYDDADFQMVVKYFDEIFWEINQSYALDFLPWLLPFYKAHTDTIVGWSSEIRKFILERVLIGREQKLDLEEPEKDFTDALFKSLVEDKNVSRDTIIYMLEDFIGGHSAVGNLVMMALAYIAKDPSIGRGIQSEVDRISEKGQRRINLHDMDNMPYTMATIFEVLRYASSPIVPHVATEDAVIAGYGVTKGTVVFINNYKLNTSPKYWKQPDLFNPWRFLEHVEDKEFVNPHNTQAHPKTSASDSKRRNSEGSDSGIEYDKELAAKTSLLSTLSSKPHNIINIMQSCNEKVKLKKNLPHFLPFSIGKRTCIGQNLVRGFGFILLANIMQQYDVSSKDLSTIKIVPACVALPTNTFPLILNARV